MLGTSSMQWSDLSMTGKGAVARDQTMRQSDACRGLQTHIQVMRRQHAHAHAGAARVAPTACRSNAARREGSLNLFAWRPCRQGCVSARSCAKDGCKQGRSPVLVSKTNTAHLLRGTSRVLHFDASVPTCLYVAKVVFFAKQVDCDQYLGQERSLIASVGKQEIQNSFFFDRGRPRLLHIDASIPTCLCVAKVLFCKTS